MLDADAQEKGHFLRGMCRPIVTYVDYVRMATVPAQHRRQTNAFAAARGYITRWWCRLLPNYFGHLIVFRPHRLHEMLPHNALQMSHVAWFNCVSVLGTRTSGIKMTESIDMSFGGWLMAVMGPRCWSLSHTESHGKGHFWGGGACASPW